MHMILTIQKNYSLTYIDVILSHFLCIFAKIFFHLLNFHHEF